MSDLAAASPDGPAPEPCQDSFYENEDAEVLPTMATLFGFFMADGGIS